MAALFARAAAALVPGASRLPFVSGGRHEMPDLTLALDNVLIDRDPLAIAHGMWAKARCLAAPAPRLPERFTVEVEVRKPVAPPATVQFLVGVRDGGVSFAGRDAARGTPHLDGRADWS